MKDYAFEIEMKVRDYECDLQGVVNNSNYQHYMEHARHEFLETTGTSFSALHNQGIDVMVSRIDISYKHSLRGSDPDAALHYLARFLEAGDLITPCRRLLCAASEDVGLAYPQAITIVKSCVDTAMQLGLPEAQLPLAQAAILLATAPKSNSVCTGIMSAWADVKAGRGGDVPRELQNVHADSAGLEREQGYKYPHNYGHHWVRQQYLPDAIKNARYYHYGDNKTEQAAKSYWEKIKESQ